MLAVFVSRMTRRRAGTIFRNLLDIIRKANVLVWGHLFIFFSINMSNDKKPYDNLYKHYPGIIRKRKLIRVVGVKFEYFKNNRRLLCKCHCQHSGSNEITSILVETILKVDLRFFMGIALKSR